MFYVRKTTKYNNSVYEELSIIAILEQNSSVHYYRGNQNTESVGNILIVLSVFVIYFAKKMTAADRFFPKPTFSNTVLVLDVLFHFDGVLALQHLHVLYQKGQSLVNYLGMGWKGDVVRDNHWTIGETCQVLRGPCLNCRWRAAARCQSPHHHRSRPSSKWSAEAWGQSKVPEISKSVPNITLFLNNSLYTFSQRTSKVQFSIVII